MILVDSSVWIDVLGNRDTRQTERFRALLMARVRIGIGDLVATEILQETRSERHFRDTLRTLQGFPSVVIAGSDVAVEAARRYRHLRTLGTTPRKTIDTLIATRCILDNIPLLYSARDFEPFVQHLGLRSAMDLDPGVT